MRTTREQENNHKLAHESSPKDKHNNRGSERSHTGQQRRCACEHCARENRDVLPVVFNKKPVFLYDPPRKVAPPFLCGSHEKVDVKTSVRHKHDANSGKTHKHARTGS